MKHESMKRKKEYFATLQHCSLLSSLNGRRSLEKKEMAYSPATVLSHTPSYQGKQASRAIELRHSDSCAPRHAQREHAKACVEEVVLENRRKDQETLKTVSEN
jgi:hypothetical protein